MYFLHSIEGKIIKQILHPLRPLASNIGLTLGDKWQVLAKCKSGTEFVDPEYDFALCLHDTGSASPFLIQLSDAEAKKKLLAWGYSAAETLKILDNKEIEQ